MKCESCDGRGWIEGYKADSSHFRPTLEQCRKRCNLTGYSDEVQRRMNEGSPERQNIPAKKFDHVAPVIQMKRIDGEWAKR